MSERVHVALTTMPGPEVAERIVRQLVEEGVVACGNILPGVRSIYRWQGEVQDEAETLVIFKTTESGARRLIARMPELHPYEVPEVVVLTVGAGHAPYLDWVRANSTVDAP